MQAYNDKTLMPFGAHKNISLGNVPAYYLIFLYEKYNKGRNLYDKQLAAYIESNLHGLRLEAEAEKKRKYYERQ